MKKVISYSAIFFCVITVFISGCCHNEPAGMIVKDAQGIYQIDGNPESLDLQMTDGVIVFSRKNSFCIGATYTGRDFFWSDNRENFHLSYQGTLCFDFNKDFIFDFFYRKGKYFIVSDHERIEVNNPDFQTMQAVDLNNVNYHWDGSNWIKQQ
ncbi:MAG: hypothetical protein E7050_11505 [Lentisphaerae bacterium]|nr:hypothetical protein [Lentisphaerota bacterium]